MLHCRGDGVFDDAFTDYLNDQIGAAPDEETRCDIDVQPLYGQGNI